MFAFLLSQQLFLLFCYKSLVGLFIYFIRGTMRDVLDIACLSMCPWREGGQFAWSVEDCPFNMLVGDRATPYIENNVFESVGVVVKLFLVHCLC